MHVICFTSLSSIAEEQPLVDERLNTLAGANDLPVAVLVLIIHLPPPGVVVRKRGEAPEDGTSDELHQLGHDRNVVDDLWRDSIKNISPRKIPTESPFHSVFTT